MCQYRPILFAVFLFVCVSGCVNKQGNIEPSEQAIFLRNAINANDFNILADSIALPLVIREQEWETAVDGYGYVLGAKNTFVVSNSKDLIEALRILERVEILGEAPLGQDFTIADFKGELSGIDQQWKPLDLEVFFRGQGDVEHIVILGLDKKTEKLRAIYIN